MTIYGEINAPSAKVAKKLRKHVTVSDLRAWLQQLYRYFFFFMLFAAGCVVWFGVPLYIVLTTPDLLPGLIGGSFTFLVLSLGVVCVVRLAKDPGPL